MYKSYKKNGKLWTLGAFELPITYWLKKKFPVQSEVTLEAGTSRVLGAWGFSP